MTHAFPCGTLFLDFVGTLRARRNAAPTEMLASPESLDDWFVESGMLDAAPGADEADLATAVDLREAIYSVVAAHLAGEPLPAAALAEVNRQAAGLPVRVQLAADGTRRRTGSVSQALVVLARETVETLSEVEGLLRECSRPECTQVYIDRSRGPRREWCSMKTCGNRVKAAAYRARRHSRTG
ncbi:ABATE domain-containing protein [Streptomyces sp. NPDC052727]|uniref:CGNR zinc finger domain-containing protein n=1 Tax=Streptomyces sp. NPDC052727 TaxID=3154854 RepID=UPI003430E18C